MKPVTVDFIAYCFRIAPPVVLEAMQKTGPRRVVDIIIERGKANNRPDIYLDLEACRPEVEREVAGRLGMC